MTRPVSGILLGLLVLGTLTCGGEGSGPSAAPPPGLLELSLVTPNPDDCALLLEVTGGPVSHVLPLGGLLSYQAARVPGVTRIALIGPLASGPVARLRVPDIGQAARYAVTVVSVADQASLRLRKLAGYSATLLP